MIKINMCTTVDCYAAFFLLLPHFTLTGSLPTNNPVFEMARAASSAACLDSKLTKLTFEDGTIVADFIDSPDSPNAALSLSSVVFSGSCEQYSET